MIPEVTGTLFDRPIPPEAYALIRFGLGYPRLGAPVDPGLMLDRLDGPDLMARQYPFVPFSRTMQLARDLRDARRLKRRTGDGTALTRVRNEMKAAFLHSFQDDLARAVDTDDPLRERLTAFWFNHFAARPKTEFFRTGHTGYIADAIRPHLTGRFATMLKAVVTHPFMIVYLDQQNSIGPNSPAGRKKGRGLNENLAREVLELHTLGVDGGYTQQDVREFAELLTGVTITFRRGFEYFPQRAEPGAETVLGKAYGGGKAKLADIFDALEDLAAHPATARHICRKLAAHFVADDPDAGLVQHMEAAYRDSGGVLRAVYAAMLEHPAAWSGFGAKVKLPMELIATSLRAVGISGKTISEMPWGAVRKGMYLPMARMGQPYARPPGPDGFADRASAWIHPQGVAARIGYAMRLAQRMPGGTPDPRALVEQALPQVAGPALQFAARAAEDRVQGVGLILASAEFNRR